MYYLIDSPTVITEVPEEEKCLLSASSGERFIAVCVANHIYFHCQKTFALLGYYKLLPQLKENIGDVANIFWNETGSDLLIVSSLGFIVLVHLTIEECENQETVPFPPFTVQVKGVQLLSTLGQISCCVTTCQKIIVGSRTGRIFGLTWSGQLIPDEDINIHSIAINSDLENTAVANYLESAVYCEKLFWAPTLGGLLSLLTDGRLVVFLLSFLQLDPSLVRAVWVPDVRNPAAISVNDRFRNVTIGDTNGNIVTYGFDEVSNSLVVKQNFRLPDPVKYGIDKVPGAVKTISWSPDGYCLAVAWKTHGLALWSVFGALLYTTLLDQTAVTRFLSPLDFCWAFRGFHLWTVASFMNDPDRRARIDNLAVFRERLQQNSNALPSTQRQIVKNVSKMKTQLGLGDNQLPVSSSSSTSSKNNADNIDVDTEGSTYLMVFKIAKSALVMNPTMDNHLHALFCTPDSVLLSIRRVLHSCRNLLCLPLPFAYSRVNTPLKFVALNTQGGLLAVAGRRAFALCLLPTHSWRLFGNVTQEQSFEVHAGLAWWFNFICFSAFNYVTNRCEIRCYPSTEKLDNSFVSCLPLEASVRPLFLDVVGNRIFVFSTDSHYRSFLLAPGQRNTEVSILAQTTINMTGFFPFASCLTRICPFSLQKPSPVSASTAALGLNPGNAQAQSKSDKIVDNADMGQNWDTGVLATYAGNLLFFPQLSQITDEVTSSSFTDFFTNFSWRETNPKKYSDTFVPTLIASNVEFLWLCTNPTPCTSCPSAHPPPEDSEDEDREDFDVSTYSTDSINTLSIPLLSGSVWIQCGSQGLKIWFPLSYREVGRSAELGQQTSPGYLRKSSFDSQQSESSSRVFFPSTSKGSRRVMLSLRLDSLVYPLTVLLDKAVVIASQNGYLRTDRSYTDALSDRCIQMPWSFVQLKTNLFLPHLLKDLLSKNLSSIAHDLASAYQSLGYFQHILELLLHEVLEEEATSKYPIPDPLLPQVTAFIEQFPQFLDVIVQCTRKTEVTWWRHLFYALGRRPTDIFEHAISVGQLDTATSCLVVLQNSESLATSTECARILLRKTMEESQWHLVNDLIRFLKATSMPAKLPGFPAKKEVPGSVQGEADPFNEVDMFIERVKWRLLRDSEWRQLEEVFANLPSTTGYSLSHSEDIFQNLSISDLAVPQWILRNRDHISEIEDWPLSLIKLSSDFEWFLPLGSSQHQLGIKRSTLRKMSTQNGFIVSSTKVSFSEDPPIDLQALSRSLPAPDHPKAADPLSFAQASRSYQQCGLLLTHLMWVAHEVCSSPRLSQLSASSHDTVLSWCVLVSVLTMNQQQLFVALSLIRPDRSLAEVLSHWLETGIVKAAFSHLRLPRILRGLESLEAWAEQTSVVDYANFFREIKPSLLSYVATFVKHSGPLSGIDKHIVDNLTSVDVNSDQSVPLAIVPVTLTLGVSQDSVPVVKPNLQQRNGGPILTSMVKHSQVKRRSTMQIKLPACRGIPSLKPVRGQHMVDAEFETTSERHLVNPDSSDDADASVCAVS